MERAKIYQLLFLSSFMLIGVFHKDFSVQTSQILLTFSAGFLTQYAFVTYLRLKNISWWSTAITCFGTCLLLRSNTWWIHPCAATLAISSKFIFRWRGRHLFNPANFGVVLALLFSGNAWLSPGQWGENTILLFWIMCLGLWVTQASKTIPGSLTFLAIYTAILGGRNLWLGNPLSIWWHQLQNGSLILFTFFMISDPATLPKKRVDQVFHFLFVSLSAYYWQFKLFKPNGLVYGLFLSSFLTPLAIYIVKCGWVDKIQACKNILSPTQPKQSAA